MVLELDSGTPAPEPADALPASLPFVVVGIVTDQTAVPPRGDAIAEHGWLRLCDVAVGSSDPALERVLANLETHPITATALALLLRGQPERSLDAGLVAESATYSFLQAGPEFAAWREANPPRPQTDGDEPRVRAERDSATLRVTLTRPERLNALDARMRDELSEALTIAAADPSLSRVELRGEGRAFCAGGDLDEFGMRQDPASAHVVRLQRSVGRTLARLRQETVAYVHGACVGSGAELAAFCDRVVAADDTHMALPEIGLGLVPGAGGTVSLTKRLGRLRTAWLAFSGCAIDADTARSWGLADAVGP